MSPRMVAWRARIMRWLGFLAVYSTLGAAAVAGCHGQSPPGAPGSARADGAHAGIAQVASNITRADYAGSAACEPCHQKEYRAWLDSPMHRMTRDLHRTQIAAPFDGHTFDLR